LRCGRGGGGVFVITDSWSWFRAEGFQTREHTNNPLAQKHTFARVRFRLSSYSRLRKPMVGSSVWAW
ncbi:hypothetical protein ACQX3D_10630, partial [Corynebacterium diphtheriae]